MTSSASRCSFTTMAPRPIARAPAARARTSTTPRSVAERIGIPHYVLDYESRFKEAVIDRFAESYIPARRRCLASTATCRSSSTTCLITARELGAEVLATGHYVASRTLARRRPRALSRRAKKSATRAISCSAPRASNSTSCASRSATAPSRRRANWRASSAWRSPTSTTARTSASCRPAITPTSSSG